MAYTEAQKKASIKYMDKTYDRLYVKVRKGNKEIIEDAAKKENKSLNGYVLEAIDEKLVKGGNPSILESKEGD